ncbi:hypothetical protein [Winogradskyella tangerina]|uniref:hypothetical protein n=1 Tax=Winogradskyella tangerina TaxID=2023240 RepID=UPI000DBE427C|nr:hypothetical protein [Winogradskyella tangerina]
MKANSWIKVLNFQNQNLNKDHSNFFGYTYIDHEAGLTVDALKFFKIENDSIQITEDAIATNQRTILRSEALNKASEVSYATEDEIKEFNLNVPDYLKIYSKPKLELFREEKLFDEFRAQGYPDDVMVLLPPHKDIRPEQVWLRVEEYSPENKIIGGTLLNQPHQNFGVNKNDVLIAVYTEIKGDAYLIASIDFEKIPKKKKWKFW